MIIDPNDPAYVESPKVAEARAAAEAAAASTPDETDAPPDYADIAPPTFITTYTNVSPPQAGSSSMAAAAPQQKATNFVFVEMANSKVRGSYHIDPSLSIPAALLPPSVAALPEFQRKNIHLFSKNGSVESDVLFSSSNEERDAKRAKRATLAAGSANGSVTIRVRRQAVGAIKRVTPIQISVASRNGSVRVSVPADFVGPMTITSHNGSIKLSQGLTARCATNTHEKHTKRCFIGDMSLYEGDEWYGDELNIESNNGSVTVNETTDGDNPDYTTGYSSYSQSVKISLFSRIFG